MNCTSQKAKWLKNYKKEKMYASSYSKTMKSYLCNSWYVLALNYEGAHIISSNLDKIAKNCLHCGFNVQQINFSKFSSQYLMLEKKQKSLVISCKIHFFPLAILFPRSSVIYWIHFLQISYSHGWEIPYNNRIEILFVAKLRVKMV